MSSIINRKQLTFYCNRFGVDSSGSMHDMAELLNTFLGSECFISNVHQIRVNIAGRRIIDLKMKDIRIDKVSLRWCPVCKEDKPLAKFRRLNGYGAFHKYCVECRRKENGEGNES